MLIYECDMCKKQFASQDCVHEISVVRQRDDIQLVDGMEMLMVCDECSRKIGEFVRGYKSRMAGLNCTIDPRFSNGGGQYK